MMCEKKIKVIPEEKSQSEFRRHLQKKKYQTNSQEVSREFTGKELPQGKS